MCFEGVELSREGVGMGKERGKRGIFFVSGLGVREGFSVGVFTLFVFLVYR